MSRILVVEDEQHLADGLRFNLEAEQHDVDVVDNGEQALERLLAEPQRASISSILDVMLPGIDGFGVVAELRRGRPVRAGPDADRARPAGGRAARASSRAPTTTCRSRSSCRSSWPASRACCGGDEWFRLGDRPRPAGADARARFRSAERTIDFEQLEVHEWARSRCR